MQALLRWYNRRMNSEWIDRIGAPTLREPIAAPYYNQEFEQRAAQILGSKEIPDCLTRVAGRPWLAAAMLPFFMRHDTVAAEPDQAARMLLLSSALNDCRYSYGLFRSRLLLVGHRPEELDLLTEAALAGRSPSRLTQEQRALVELARYAAHPERDPGERARTFDLLESSGFSVAAANELAAAGAQTGFFNRVCTLLAIPPYRKAEATPKRFFVPLLRPFVARIVEGRKIAPTQTPDTDVPFADLIGAIAGTWYALWVAITADRCLDADNEEFATAGRLAVIETIAGEMGATAVRDEAHRRLSSLPAPELPEGISDWCRLTVNSGAEPAQELTARLAEQVEPMSLIDIVGTAALANLLSRLELLLDSPSAPPQASR